MDRAKQIFVFILTLNGSRTYFEISALSDKSLFISRPVNKPHLFTLTQHKFI